MDLPLREVALAEAKDLLARAWLAGPAPLAELGDIRLAPHQIEAASRLVPLLMRHGGALLADSTGMGKTFVAIAVMRVLGDTLVVAPAALRAMWTDALRRTRTTARLASYDELGRRRLADMTPPALLVLDEAHHVRNPATRRYAAVADLAWGARVLLMTATPIHNRGEDLRALLALFVGARARSIGTEALAALTVRRTRPGRGPPWDGSGPGRAPALPRLDRPAWLSVDPDPETLHAIERLPPAVPARDGGAAHALLTLGLLRAWASSAAALRATLGRRLQRAAGLAAVLESGRYPTRAELAAWSMVGDAVQLGFPELLVTPRDGIEAAPLLEAIAAHRDGVRAILRSLDGHGDAQDARRVALVVEVLGADPERVVVAFSQFADTAWATYTGLAPRGGVALATGRGARIASGAIPMEELVALMDDVQGRLGAARAMPLRALVATDVMSEGLSLRRASVLVHLDLPWTLARLAQRVGRLRRMGSPHRRIAVLAIGPPVGARELSSVVRALRRKARLSAAYAGAGLPESDPLLGARLGKATRHLVARSDTQAAESLRALLTAWLLPGDRPADGSAATRVTVASPGVGCRDGTAAWAAWAALALVRQDGRLALLRVSPGGVTEGPLDVLPLARAIDRARPASDGGAPAARAGGDCREHLDRAVAEAVSRVARWQDEERGRELVGPATGSPSGAHAAVLHFLDGLMSASARADRPALAPRVARCRDAVLGARGAGAERVLQAWLLATRDRPQSAVMQALEELTGMLESRTLRPGPVGDGAGEGIVALVLLPGGASP